MSFFCIAAPSFDFFEKRIVFCFVSNREIMIASFQLFAVDRIARAAPHPASMQRTLFLRMRRIRAESKDI